MKIASGVEVLKLKGNLGNLHPALIWEESEVILVDAGLPGQVGEIREAMKQVGIPFEKLNRIIITHQDYDHIGCLKEISMDHDVEVMAHPEEKPYIEGRKPLIKMTPERLAHMFRSVPADQREEAAARFLESLRSDVQRVVEDGEVLPYGGGMTVIHTPGHTPGHISVYLNRSRTLISGDALNVVDGRLMGANPVFTSDMELAKKSIRKLADFKIETVVCYHGGVFADHVSHRLRELADQ